MTSGGERVEGRVLRSVGGSYAVEVAPDRTLDCRLRGRLKLDREIRRVVVGDRVQVERLEDGTCAIVGVLPRSSKVSRLAAHGRKEQLIAANVDQMAAVFAMAEPRPQLDLLDRFLVLAEGNGIVPFVVVNKIDLTDGAAARRELEVYERIGYDMLYTSARTGAGVEALRERLHGRTTILVGPSGVGKSSLLNAVQPELGLRVGAMSRALEAGRHTTVEATLHRLESGGYVVDTPGLRKLEFWEVGSEALDECFPEFRPHLGGCKFPDCSHVHEPDCAVRSALEQGEIEERRYRSYERILRERAARSRAY